MSAPVSNGVLRTKLSDMKIGDYIKWGYTAFSANVAGTLQEDTIGMTELPEIAASAGGGYFYYIKVLPGLLIPDRAIQLNISASSINIKNYFKGFQYRVIANKAEFDIIKNSDFNGSSLLTAVKGPVFTESLSYTGPGAASGTIFFQDLGILTRDYYGHIGTELPFTDVTVPNVQGASQASTLFYPCMEYIDSSKSTNIFY